MKLSDDNAKAILLDIHQDIDKFAESAIALIFGNNQDSLTYPPGIELTEDEIAALNTIIPNDNLKSALKKIIADNSAAVVFNLFNNIDGTGDPKNITENWKGVKLIDRPDPDDDHENFLHDEFYSTYWDWKELNFKT